jgi:hypothetical protein
MAWKIIFVLAVAALVVAVLHPRTPFVWRMVSEGALDVGALILLAKILTGRR